MGSLATDTLPEPLEKLVAQLVDDDMRELARPPAFELTQNHYGHYMGILAQLPPFPHMPANVSLMTWGIILARAGGNEQGIRDAIRVST